MAFTPTGVIYLIGSVPLDNTYEHTIDFADSTEQLAYFQGKAVYTLTEQLYSRQHMSFRIFKSFESLWGVNYLLYRNGSGKWIYNFITQKKYINESVTEIIVEIDVMQSFMWDYTFKPSYIEREHQDRWIVLPGSDVRPVLNNMPDNIYYGDEYIKTHETIVTNDQDIAWFLICSTEKLSVEADTPTPIQGVPTPLYYYVVPFKKGAFTNILNGADEILMDIVYFSKFMSSTLSVVSVSFIPYLPIATTNTYVSEINYKVDVSSSLLESLQLDNGPGEADLKIFRVRDFFTSSRAIKTIDRYADKTLPSVFTTAMSRSLMYESKLLTYPYYYYQMTDYQSTPMVIKNEYLTGSDINIYTSQVLSHQSKCKYFLGSYKGETDGKANAVVNNTVNDLPLKTDVYLNYMLNNKASATTGMSVSAVTGVAGLAVGAMTGGLALPIVAGQAMSNLRSVMGEMAKREDLKNTPDTLKSAGNNIAFDIADGNMNLKLIRYELPTYIQQVLADFWHLYGYRSGTVKLPALKTRYYFNFIKTIGCNIAGDIDNVELTKIKAIYNKGVTLWHYHSSGFTPLDYTYDNIENSLLEV